MRVPPGAFGVHAAVTPELMAISVVAEDADGFYLTAQGVDRLRILWHVSRCDRVCDCRPVADVPIDDRTSYEMLMELSNLGFVWHQLPTNPKARTALKGYAPGGVKKWYTVSNAITSTVCKYMRCLLQAEIIVALGKHSTIPHGATDAQYLAILEGRDFVAPAPSRKRKLTPAIGDMQVDGEVAVPGSAAGPARRPREAI
eukprot:9243703-Pyramimonas_sp.AAC.1